MEKFLGLKKKKEQKVHWIAISPRINILHWQGTFVTTHEPPLRIIINCSLRFKHP